MSLNAPELQTGADQAKNHHFLWKPNCGLAFLPMEASPLLLKLLRINPPLQTLSIRLAAGLSRNDHQGCLLAIQAVLENASGKSD